MDHTYNVHGGTRERQLPASSACIHRNVTLAVVMLMALLVRSFAMAVGTEFQDGLLDSYPPLLVNSFMESLLLSGREATEFMGA